ncbi:MAG: DHHA1 domain-containing protein [Helicobacter sp.]|nr:DHHA1 domain-containing protein [Helicobacter sp.]
MQKIFHLSHTDLDGYGAQFVSSHFFSDISFYNANYGREVGFRLDEIIEDIQVCIDGQISKILIFITDLNLTAQEAADLELRAKAISENTPCEIELLLLDHHITGLECSQKFPWYNLDPMICATKITYKYLLEHFTPHANKNELELLERAVEVINSIDIWDENGFGFDIGKVALRMIATANELNRHMFDAQNRQFKLNLIKEMSRLIPPLGESTANAAVELDNSLLKIKKRLLGGNENKEILDDVISNRICKLLAQKSKDCQIFYRDKMGFFSYQMGGISVLANKFLRQNKTFKFYIDINAKGNVSLRANNECDVSEIAQKCFNGGGHKNAAGGRFNGFKESFVYEDMKAQIQQALSLD